MSIKAYITIIFFSALITSCKTTPQEDPAYEVIEYVFEYLDDQLHKKIKEHSKNKYIIAKTKAKLNNPIYINPKFSHLLTSRYPSSPARIFPEIKSDFWVLGFALKFKSCNEFDYTKMRLTKDSIHYINQIKKAPDNIDLRNISHQRVRYYKMELEDEKHIKQYESWKKQGVDSITLQNRKELMLIQENGYLQISYPVFSKDNKHALIYIESKELGTKLLILKNKNKKWKHECIVSMGSH